MGRNVPLASLATLAGIMFVQAQEMPAGPGLRAGNIRASGQTVPNPATLPNAQRSAVERPVEGKDRGRTNYGICKGC